MPDKRDWLHLCNEFQVPTEDFNLQHCQRCFQAECTRSQHGKGQFDQRVSTWEQRLFTETPKMDESDPRIEVIRAKKFVEIDTGAVPEVGQGTWIDPRGLTDEPAPPVVAPPVAPPVTPTPIDEPVAEPQIQSGGAPMMNTPNRPGQMIGGHEKPAQKPAVDPWAPKKEANPSGDQVVKPGARIRFGGSGV